MVISTRTYALLFFILCIANVGIYRSIFFQKEISIETFSVGKGSATLVETAGGRTVLIDAGSDASILRELGTRLVPWQRTIDVLLLQSTGSKDVGGAPDVLSRYNVKTLARPSGKGTYTWESALAAAASADMRIIYMKPGDTLSLDGTQLPLK